MRRFAKIFLLLAGMFGMLQAYSQSGTKISGRVVDSATNQVIAGASVVVTGSRKGTATDAEGRFIVVAKPGDNLTVNAVGYVQQIVKATDGISVTLSTVSANLQDVVVVGYGSQRRANITGAISVVKGEQLIRRPVASTSMALQGFAPGVTVRQGSGQPGADGGQINIRGFGSISNGTGPLIVVDGVEGVSLNDIDPNVIESISILKDAASTAVYGVRATNGVILVKTKRGQSGKASVSYNAFVSMQNPTNMPKTLSAVDNMILNNEAVANTGSTSLPYSQALIDFYKANAANNYTVFDTDWQDLIFQNSGLMQNHNIIVSGGSDKASFLASGTYLNQQGLIVNNSFRKFDLRINGDINVSKKLKFTTDLFYTKAENIVPAGMGPTQIIQRAISMAKNFPGKFNNGFYGDAGQSNSYNPVAFAEASGTQRTETPTLSMRFGLRFEPIKNLVFEGAYNARSSWTQSVRANRTYDVYTPNPATSGYNYSAAIGDSSINFSTNRVTSNQYYASGTYSIVPAANHNVKVQLGFQALDNYVENTTATRFGLLYPNMPYFNSATGSPLAPTVGGGATKNSNAGFFGRINYDYKSRYLLEITGRRDGSSRFSQLAEKQWGFFPGISAGWIISKENFFDAISKFVNYAKIRASYGALGNQEVAGNYAFAAILNPRTDYYFNNQLTIGASLGNVQNATLGWETSTQMNLGIDLAFLKNKLSVTFDYYEKKINDIIIDLPLPLYAGFPTASTVPTNAGSMINKGWEFSATYRNSFGKLNYSITGNLSDVKNEVLDTRGQDIVTPAGLIARAGFPINSYNLYTANGLYQTGDNTSVPTNSTRLTGPGDIKYVDINGDGILNAADRQLMGNNFPRYEYSFDLNANYKGFDLNVFIFGVAKRDNYISGVGVEPFNGGNWIASGLEPILDRWTVKNPGAKYPRLYSGGNGNYIQSTYWLRNGAFMRIKNITLGYNLPTNWMTKAGIQSARFYVSLVNPFTISDYEPGFDPEISNTNGAFYPIMKTTTIGCNIKF